MLTRRSFIRVVLGVPATLVAGCRSVVRSQQGALNPAVPAPTPTASPSPSPTPTIQPTPTPAPVPVSLWIDPTVPSRFADAANSVADRIARRLEGGFTLARSDDERGADIRVTMALDPPPDSVSLVSEPLILATSPRVFIREVTVDQARDLLGGAVADWSQVGAAASQAVVPVTILPVDASPAPGTQRLDSYEAFVSALAKRPGTVALIPMSAIDFRASALAIDGNDVLRHPERASDYPFQQHLVLEVASHLPPGVQAVIDEAAQDVAGAPAAPTATTVTMVGDVILGRTVHTIMTRLNDFAAPFRQVADELKQANLTIADLECSLSDTIAPPTDPFTFSFTTFTDGAEGLKLAGIDGVSQANNHSMNFGAQGMHDTLAALDAAGIRHFGIGDDLEQARQPAIFDVNGLRLAFLGYDGITGTSYGATGSSPGTSPLVADYVVADVQAARKKADLVIPFIHWGVEYTLTPTREQRAIARRAIDAGADLVVGSHPHWVQGLEIYEGRPIIYSLGNFVFDQEWSLETKQGLILHLVFHGTRLASLRFVPVLIEDFYRPRIVDGDMMTTILDRVWASTDAIRAEAAP